MWLVGVIGCIMYGWLIIHALTLSDEETAFPVKEQMTLKECWSDLRQISRGPNRYGPTVSDPVLVYTGVYQVEETQEEIILSIQSVDLSRFLNRTMLVTHKNGWIMGLEECRTNEEVD